MDCHVDAYQEKAGMKWAVSPKDYELLEGRDGILFIIAPCTHCDFHVMDIQSLSCHCQIEQCRELHILQDLINKMV